MFDNDCNMNTLSGTIEYCKKRGFTQSDCDCFNPFEIYNDDGTCFCQVSENDRYYKDNIDNESIDPYDRLEAYFGEGFPNITNDDNYESDEEIITRESIKCNSDILDLPNYIVPFNTPHNNFEEQNPKPKSPIKVKLSINNGKYDLTYSNIRNNNIYGVEMDNKKMDIDLFDELTYYYKQRHFIKDSSKRVIESANPQNIKINKGDIVKIHQKVFIVKGYKPKVLRHELKELKTNKLYEYNLSKNKFSIILQSSTKNEIIFFNKDNLRSVSGQLPIDNNSLDIYITKSDTHIQDSNDYVVIDSIESIDEDVEEIIEEDIEEDTDENYIKLIDNYFSDQNKESIYQITSSVPKIVLYEEYEMEGNGIQKPLCNGLDKKEPEIDNIEKNESTDDNDSGNTNDTETEDSVENTTESNGYCTIM